MDFHSLKIRCKAHAPTYIHKQKKTNNNNNNNKSKIIK